MKLTKLLTQQLTRIGLAAVLLSTLNLQLSTAHAQGTQFTYQGRLDSGGGPANGSYDLTFTMFNATTGGTDFGTVTTNGTFVTDGLFTVTLDFGSSPYISGAAQWLEIAVRTNGAATFSTLAPRQPLHSTPYAYYAYAVNASSLIGQVTDANLAATFVAPHSFTHPGSSFTGNGSGLTALNASQLTSGTLPDARLSANVALRAGGNAFTGNQSVMSGNVGIGTTTTSSTLDVFGSGSSGGAASPARALKVRSTASFGAAIGVDASTVAGGKEWDFFSTGGNAAEGRGKLILRNDTDNVNAMTITTNGNVGIGTTTPAENLSVATSTSVPSASSAKISLAAFGGHRWQMISVSGFDTNSTVNLGIPAGSFQLYDENGAGFGQSTLTFTPNGNLGIGSLNPQAKLEIVGRGDGKANGLRLSNTASANGGYWNIWQQTGGGVDALIFSYKDQQAAGGAYSYLTPTSAGLISTSDRRAKMDINAMSPCLDKLMALKPTTFRYKSAAEGTPLNYGFIAQEIEVQFPDLVQERNGMKSLVAQGITAINTRAIQDLKLEKDAELAKLRAELSQLRSEKASLTQTISDMEARFVRLEQAMNNTTLPAVKDVSASADVK